VSRAQVAKAATKTKAPATAATVRPAVAAAPAQATKSRASAAGAVAATKAKATKTTAVAPSAASKTVGAASRSGLPAEPVAAAAGEKRRTQAAAPPAKSATRAAAGQPVRAVPDAPPTPAVVVQASPRPLGKRAAKKVMMEQMTQAAVVPSHAPDAAKATFSHMNERVMTPQAPSAVKKDPTRSNNWKTVPVDQLTDQDVLAMPDSEYMNDVQLAFFRRKLSQLKADMLANAGETTEHLREDTAVVPDPADRATIEEEHALELRTRDRERKLLKKIEQSIARIDNADYGYCDETGEPIGVGRLLARPTASFSLEAQQRRELKQKMFGD